MAELIYVLCAITSVICAIMLFRGFARTRGRMLLWTAIFFAAQAITNVMLFFDLVIVPDTDLGVFRSAITLVGVIGLLYGLIRETA